MSARQPSDPRCPHKTTRMIEGALFIVCDDCGAPWMAIDSIVDTFSARPVFNRSFDPDCPIRTRPVSEPPPKP